METESFENATAANGNGESASQMAGGIHEFKKANRQKVSPISTDRLPPHADDMERGVLGCILLSPTECINQCLEKLTAGVEVFYDLRHQEIYRELLAMFDEKTGIDVLTLQQRLKDRDMLNKIGGIPYLNQLQDSVPSAANLAYYADIVSEKCVLRKILHACTSVAERVYDFQGGVDSLLDNFEKDVLAFQADRKPRETLGGKASSDRMMNDLERRFALNGALSGLDTGFLDLNRMTEGLQFGEQAVIGARPSQGKTALGLDIFRNVAFKLQVPALFISLEMSVESLMRRMLAAQMSVPLQELRRGSYEDGKFKTFALFNGMCARHPLHIIDGISGMSCRELCATVRRMVLKHGVKLVVIDYLQKIKPDTKHEKRTYEVGDVSGKLKALAVETNVAMLTLAQLNRENVQQKGRAPRLSDLADSGQIERDADLVGLIHREGCETKLLIAKQRDGETGLVKLIFDGTYCRFENCANGRDYADQD